MRTCIINKKANKNVYNMKYLFFFFFSYYTLMERFVEQRTITCLYYSVGVMAMWRRRECIGIHALPRGRRCERDFSTTHDFFRGFTFVFFLLRYIHIHIRKSENYPQPSLHLSSLLGLNDRNVTGQSCFIFVQKSKKFLVVV